MQIRRECLGDAEAIDALVHDAFLGHPHSDGSEPEIIRRLRQSGALSLSLVAEKDSEIIGHIAFSPVGFSDGTSDWFAIGPLAVAADHRNKGIASSLMLGGLELMKDEGAGGAVLLGDIGFYGRFGFQPEPNISSAGLPSKGLLFLPFEGEMPSGEVAFHRAFFGPV